MATKRAIIGLLACCVLANTSQTQAISEIERNDWYFRESLVSIRDWESTLNRLDESSSPVAVPVLPLPSTGRLVGWSNPIPRLLLPANDRGDTFQFRWHEEQIEFCHRTATDSHVIKSSIGGEVAIYQHPGSGGKDQWYHAYHRKFDRLLRVRPSVASFDASLHSPTHWRPGVNLVSLGLSKCIDEYMTVVVSADLHLPDKSHPVGRWTVELDSKEESRVDIPVSLDRTGGGILSITLSADGHEYGMVLCTSVEDVESIIEGIALILEDSPNSVGDNELEQLKRDTDRSVRERNNDADESWTRLFERASLLRDGLLRSRIDFDSLLFVKRQPYFSEQPFMDAHHLFNRPGGGIYRLSPVEPNGKVSSVVDNLGEGVYRDACLSWDASRIVFAFGNGSDKWQGDQNYNLFEVGVDGTQLRQLTSSPRNDCEPIYLADGRIAFTSDRSGHYVMCGGDRHAPTLFAMDCNGGNIEQLSHNVFNEFNPTQLPDGRILYSRWEYNERSVTSLHNPFTMNPDGTMVSPVYGNATIRPNVVMFPRPVPNSNQLMALFTAHHGQTHGSIGLINTRLGADRSKPLTVLTPHVPITGEKAEDSRYGWYSDPVPLSESTYLCSFTPTVVPWREDSWALYVGDRHGQLALIFRDPEISCAEPSPLRARPRPHVIPAGVDGSNRRDESAELVLADVYEGLPDAVRGAARYLRVVEDVPRKDVDRGGVIVTADTLMFTVKRIWGTVPIEADGSAHFVVPADRNVYFEVLDSDQLEIQRMRSVVCLKPGERRSCIGCHEPRNQAPPARSLLAGKHEPDWPHPPPWGARIVSYLRDVQPVLNAKCVQCHTHGRYDNGVILTDDLTDRFCVAYEELLPFIRTAISDRWDHPDDVYQRPPYTYGSGVSPLCDMLAKGHHDVTLSSEERSRINNWVDANAVYYDRYEHWYGPQRSIFSGPEKDVLTDVFGRRCANCHSRGDGKHGSWWLSINRRDVTLSRALAAPLNVKAGGWGRCDEIVFEDVTDEDYISMQSVFSAVAERLRKVPRADLRSILGTNAERQTVEIPDPPPRSPSNKDIAADDVFLSDLAWASARSGWSPDDDLSPRRDRDIRGERLKMGARSCAKGVGTHAPSEIVVAVSDKYARFLADAFAAEATGSVVFKVFGDDQLLAETPVLQGGCRPFPIDVSIGDVKELRLVVTDGGDNHYCDMANWCNARFVTSKGQ